MEELLFNIISCEEATITTPNVADDLDLISEMQESPQIGSTHRRKYIITISKNCCVGEDINVPVFYNFASAFTTCSLVVGTPNTYTFGFSLSGINPLFISSLRMSKDNELNYQSLSYTNLSGNTGIGYTLVYNSADVLIPNAGYDNPPNTEDYTYFLEITHLDGFVYTIELTFRLEQPGGCELISHSIVDVTYPEFDDRLEFDDEELNLIPLISTDSVILTGVYEIIICRQYVSNPLTITSLSTNCVQNNYFIDCGITCDLINKLIQCKDTNIFTFYDALIYANDCNTSYEDMCALYEILTDKLNNPDCRDPYDDCNCNDSRDTYFEQRGYNNNKVTTKKCGSCGQR